MPDCIIASLLLTLVAPVVSRTIQRQDGTAPGVPPEVGTVAKPVEPVNWLHVGLDGRIPEIVELRGQVVLVHTWGYYCGPCMRAGVPYVVDLMKAQRANGLRAYSITVPISDGEPEDHFVKVGRDVGINHPMGYSDGYGGMSPYVNMNVNKGLTWCFVIGREGGVRWAGDTSIDEEAFLAAVKDALLEDPMPPLPEGLPAALDDTVRLYVAGDLIRAAKEAAKVSAKHERKGKEGGGAGVAAAAAELVLSIDAYRQTLLERIDTALGSRDAGEYVAARRALLDRFPKEEAKRVAELDRQVKHDESFSTEVTRWTEWDDIRRAAPVLFPARIDADAKRYIKVLRKYVQRADEGTPGLQEARQFLADASDE